MRLRAYGLEVDCEVPLPGLAGAAPDGPADLVVVPGEAPPAPPDGATAESRVDDLPFRVRATGDGLDMRWGAAAFRLAGRRLTCEGVDGPRARRVLLDSALATCALYLGTEALHAGAVVVDGGAVAIAAGTGGGKSTLLAELLGAGHPLLADDVLAVDADLRAHPAPPVMNLDAARPDGDVLAELDGEAWIAVRHAHPDAAPLRSVVVLERHASVEEPVLEPLPALGVLPLMLGSGAAPERVRARFERATAITAGARVLRLRAPLSTPPRELAELVAP